MDGMTGRRIYKADPSSLEGVKPGDYWQEPDGKWSAACPGQKLPDYKPEHAHEICLAGLGNHTVTEHDDGTITVNPSIRVTSTWGPDRVHHEWFHGYLERGVWRLC